MGEPCSLVSESWAQAYHLLKKNKKMTKSGFADFHIGLWWAVLAMLG